QSVMDLRHMIFCVDLPPDWPFGVVAVEHSGDVEWIDLPEIMLWGKEAPKSVEESIQQLWQLRDQAAG
ncbi:MAG: hypothetical protein ABI873_00935, partial [Marmoricola sp.]